MKREKYRLGPKLLVIVIAGALLGALVNSKRTRARLFLFSFGGMRNLLMEQFMFESEYK